MPPPPPPQPQPQPHLRRVSRACQRCRRQKLKCDEVRPCTMCTRAGVSCQARDTMNTSIRRKKRAVRDRSQTAAAATSSNQDLAFEAEAAGGNRSFEGYSCGASSSVVGFAVNVFGQRATLDSSDISGIPGRASPQPNPRTEWTLEQMAKPPPEVMNAALQAYFDHMHWFIFVFHEGEFMRSVTPLLHQDSWSERSRGRVMAALTAAAVGLQCVVHNPKWSGHSLLAASSLQAASLRDSLIAEVRLHVPKLLDECNLESVQVCLLLGTYYIYHGSPGLAWNMLGLSVRSAYALSMHCAGAVTHTDPVLSQVYRRTWNHITVADTYSAMIYGRPASLDAAFCNLHEMTELEDTYLPPPVLHLLQDPNANGLMFHGQKHRLYRLIRTALYRLRLIDLQTAPSPELFASLVEAIVNAQASLDTWESEVPPILKEQFWRRILNWHRRHAVLIINRPLLEYQARPEFQDALAEHASAVRSSMDISLKAALCVSSVSPIHHESEFSLSFVPMNFFTAGVISCLAPTLWPFGKAANEAKSGVLRIIRASRNFRSKSKIAKHTEQLLTRLLKLSLQQELENALDNTKNDNNDNGSAGNARLNEHDPIPSQRAFTSQSSRLQQTESSSPSTLLPSANAAQHPPVDAASYSTAGISADDFCLDPMQEGANLDPRLDLDLDIPDSSCHHQIDSYMDEILGAFGEMLFNLVPNDPYNS